MDDLEPTKPPKRGKGYDWDALFVDFAAGNLTVQQFGKSRGMSEINTYAQARRYRWRERRKELNARAYQKALDKIGDRKAINFAKHHKANNRLLKFLQRRLKDAGDKGMDAAEIKTLSDALEKIMKNKSFMEGGPTDRIESKSLNLHIDIVKLNERFQSQRE